MRNLDLLFKFSIIKVRRRY